MPLSDDQHGEKTSMNIMHAHVYHSHSFSAFLFHACVCLICKIQCSEVMRQCNGAALKKHKSNFEIEIDPLVPVDQKRVKVSSFLSLLWYAERPFSNQDQGRQWQQRKTKKEWQTIKVEWECGWRVMGEWWESGGSERRVKR